MNVEESVAKESRPLLGADIAVRSDQTFTGNLRDIIHPALGDTSKLVFSEKIELETTLFDTSGKTGLVKIVIVDENYPMRSVFDRKILPGVADASTGISVTQNVIDRFVVDGKLTLDDQKFTITAVIQESSELGIGFGDEGYLVILPKKLSEKLSFLERGARYERNLLINTSEE